PPSGQPRGRTGEGGTKHIGHNRPGPVISATFSGSLRTRCVLGESKREQARNAHMWITRAGTRGLVLSPGFRAFPIGLGSRTRAVAGLGPAIHELLWNTQKNVGGCACPHRQLAPI